MSKRATNQNKVKMSESQTMIQITEWHSQNERVALELSDMDSESEDETSKVLSLKIYIFGKTIEGENVSVIVNGFPCFFYLSLPEQWFPYGKMNKARVKMFVDSLLRRLRRDDRDAFIQYEICMRRKFRGFSNNKKFPFLRLSFQNKKAMRNCSEIFIYKNSIKGNVLDSKAKDGLTRIYTHAIKNKDVKAGDFIGLSSYNIEAKEYLPDSLVEVAQVSNLDEKKTEITIKGEYDLPDKDIIWTVTRGDGNSTFRKPIHYIPGLMYNKSEKVELYESNIDPMLRFLHIKNLSPCGWISVPSRTAQKSTLTESTTEYIVDWQEVKSCQTNHHNPIKSLAFDIECGSSHGDFPQAIKGYTKLAKELLELPTNKIKPEYIKNVLENIFINRFETINRVYVKERKRLDNELIEYLSYTITRYLWVNKVTNEYRLSGHLSFKKEELMRSLYLTKVTEDEFLEEIAKICEIIPTLKIGEKESFCGWKSTQSDGSFILSYDEDRDPTCYTEVSLTALLDSRLPKLEGDRCIQIGACFLKQGDVESYRKIILNLGTCDNFSEDVEVEVFPNNNRGEAKLLKRFRDLIISENPDIITGYNTFSFDWPYLFDRASELGISEEFSKISRLKDRECKVIETNSKGAMGKFVEIYGRVNLDLFKVVQRDFNLPSYRLDSVSAEFIRGKVSDIESGDDTGSIVLTDNTIGLKPGNFVQFIVEKGYDTDYLNNGAKYEIIEVNKKSIKVNGKLVKPKEGKCLWCLGKDDISPQDIFKSQTGTSYDRAIIAKYCVMDVVLCLELMNKLQIINNNVGMANVCSTPLSWIFKRGQGIKILSLVSKECRDKKYVIPTLFPDTYGDDSYEGAIVLKPYPGIYLDDEPVSVLDYASLYPNSMRSKNLSHETLCTDKKWLGEEGKKRLKSLGYDCVDIEYDNYKGSKDKKVKTGKCHVRFVQPKNDDEANAAIIPNILNDLLNARKTTRKKIIHKSFQLKDGSIVEGLVDEKNENKSIAKVKLDDGNIKEVPVTEIEETKDRYSKFEQSVFDGLQLAYKITANSLYGQIGARTSAVYWKDIAAATTATGREQLYIAKDFIEENYPGSKIVYGDTDSVFVKFRLVNEAGEKLRGKEALKKSIDLGVEAGKRISKILKKPQDLEYEKTFQPFILLSKKRYVGNKYEFDVNEYKQTSMGIVLKRRDNAMILKVIYGGVIDIILDKMSITPAIDFLQISLRNLVKGKYGLDKLIVTKTLNDGYKNPESIAHKVLADRIGERDPGNKPQLFDRIPFAYFQTKEKNPLQGDRIENPDYMRANGLKPDYEFYITNQIMKPISQIFALSIEDIPTLRNCKDKYQQLEEKYKLAKMDPEKMEKKLLSDKQKEVADHLFSDILMFCDSQKNGNQSITKWFG